MSEYSELDPARARLRDAIERGESAYPKKLKREAYDERLRSMQIELLKLQRWVRDTGARVCILFEGRDAAGKGGAIKRFTEHLNPRGARVVALPKPSDVEATQWYFQRYVAHLPAGGEIVLFDRSWYNRAGVERVMGFCTGEQYLNFINHVPMFERMLVDDGIYLFKLWFAVGQGEQKSRFEDRKKDPLKHWKLSPIDLASLERYDAYSEAVADMMLFSDTDHAPWTVINGNEKRRARLGALEHVLSSLPYSDKGKGVDEPDPHVVAPACALFDKGDLILRRH